MILNIVIPLGGKGKRFYESGYSIPKPLIEINNVTLLEHVLHNILSKNLCKIYKTNIYLLSSSVLKKYEQEINSIMNDIQQIYNNISYQIHYDPIDNEFQGPAYACLTIKDLINNNDKLIIANSDQYINDYNFMYNAISYFNRHNADGGIISFWADDPKWSFSEIKNNQVIRVAEKEVISNFATAGIYYFRKGKYFIESLLQLIEENNRINGEFYVGPCYNKMVEGNKKILSFFVNEMYGLGTPQDLEMNKQYL